MFYYTGQPRERVQPGRCFHVKVVAGTTARAGVRPGPGRGLRTAFEPTDHYTPREIAGRTAWSAAPGRPRQRHRSGLLTQAVDAGLEGHNGRSLHAGAARGLFRPLDADEAVVPLAVDRPGSFELRLCVGVRRIAGPGDDEPFVAGALEVHSDGVELELCVARRHIWALLILRNEPERGLAGKGRGYISSCFRKVALVSADTATGVSSLAPKVATGWFPRHRCLESHPATKTGKACIPLGNMNYPGHGC